MMAAKNALFDYKNIILETKSDKGYIIVVK